MIDTELLEEMLEKWGRWFGPSAGAGGGGGPKLSTGSILASAIQRLRVGPVPTAPEPVLGEKLVLVRAGSRPVFARVSLRYTAKGHESRRRHGSSTAIVRYTDPEALRVEEAALRLWHHHQVRGVVLRAEYCTGGKKRSRAAWAAECLELPGITVRRYRAELRAAKAWMGEELLGFHGRRGAPGPR